MKKIPKYFAIDLVTGPCNNHCKHCYSKIPQKIKTLNYDEIINIIENTKKSNLSELVVVPWMLMLDPLLIKDLEKLIIYMKENFPKGYNGTQNLASNLSVVSRNPEKIRRLKKNSIGGYQFTFYGVGETHDKFAGREGAFDDIMKAIPFLLKENIAVYPIIWLHNKIGKDLQKIKNILEKFNIMPKDEILPAHIPDPLGWQLVNDDNRPTYNDLIEYRELLPKHIFDFMEGDICKKYLSGKLPQKDETKEKELSEKEKLQNIMCSYTILPNGDIYPFWEPIHPLFKLGNIFENKMDEIHKLHFGGNYEGYKIMDNYNKIELVKKWGNVNSKKLFSCNYWVIGKYKLQEFYEKNSIQ
jgi:MoaA/NifB/PqqE/SkfB family radical SAM enzyme